MALFVDKPVFMFAEPSSFIEDVESDVVVRMAPRRSYKVTLHIGSVTKAQPKPVRDDAE